MDYLVVVRVYDDGETVDESHWASWDEDRVKTWVALLNRRLVDHYTEHSAYKAGYKYIYERRSLYFLCFLIFASNAPSNLYASFK